MKQFNTLIIEDDPIWLYRLQQMFTQLNLGPTRSATTLTQAKQLIEEQLPDLVIADIVLPDGLSFELFILNYKQIPVIFQTSFAKDEFLRKAIRMPNIGFLVKPFESFNLQAAIELLISRMPYKPVDTQIGIPVTGKYRQQIVVPFDEVCWIKGEGNYSIIYTPDQKYALKRSLRKVRDDLPTYFIQVQKAYLVNQQHIESIKGANLEVNQQLIPIGRNYRKQLLESILPAY